MERKMALIKRIIETEEFNDRDIKAILMELIYLLSETYPMHIEHPFEVVPNDFIVTC